MAQESHLVLTEKDGVTIVGFKDPTILDAYHINEVGLELYHLVDQKGLRKLVLDFSTMKMLSSQTLSVLLKMRQLLDETGGKMVLSGIKPELSRVFRITNLQNLFEFFDDIDEACASLKES